MTGIYKTKNNNLGKKQQQGDGERCAAVTMSNTFNYIINS